jgi:hypothetical protein
MGKIANRRRQRRQFGSPTFKNWALEILEPIGNSPEGDFIEDMRRDSSFPDELDHLDDLLMYVSSKGGSHPLVQKAATAVWRKYQRSPLGNNR